MGKGVRMVLAVFATYIIQTTFLPYFTFLPIKPDLLAAILAYYTMEGDTYTGFCLGAALGLLMDAMVGELPIFYLLMYPLMGYASARLARLLIARFSGRRQRIFHPTLLCAAMVALYEALTLSYIYLNGVDVTLVLVLRSARGVLYSAAAALPVYYMANFIMHHTRKKRPAKRRAG
ncbi:MAG: rod shape-determining protein MreD [Oscillospiraceae bacterium]|nr:rod shape-determining protein MreD [Oscillospiraceae bacterium]